MNILMTSYIDEEKLRMITKRQIQNIIKEEVNEIFGLGKKKTEKDFGTPEGVTDHVGHTKHLISKNKPARYAKQVLSTDPEFARSLERDLNDVYNADPKKVGQIASLVFRALAKQIATKPDKALNILTSPQFLELIKK
jgi:hypothetical protein